MRGVIFSGICNLEKRKVIFDLNRYLSTMPNMMQGCIKCIELGQVGAMNNYIQGLGEPDVRKTNDLLADFLLLTNDDELYKSIAKHSTEYLEIFKYIQGCGETFTPEQFEEFKKRANNFSIQYHEIRLRLGKHLK